MQRLQTVQPCVHGSCTHITSWKTKQSKERASRGGIMASPQAYSFAEWKSPRRSTRPCSIYCTSAISVRNAWWRVTPVPAQVPGSVLVQIVVQTLTQNLIEGPDRFLIPVHKWFPAAVPVSCSSRRLHFCFWMILYFMLGRCGRWWWLQQSHQGQVEKLKGFPD